MDYRFAAVLIFGAVSEVWGQVTTTSRVVEGARTISGVAKPGANVMIMDVSNRAAPVGLTLTGGTADATNGAFTVTLTDPLYAGQILQFSDGTSMADVTVAGLADWGRVHADFAAGTVLSYNTGFQASTGSGSSAQSTLFLSFNIEKNWKWVGIQQGNKESNKEGKKESNKEGKKWEDPGQRRVMFDTYFQTRLTSVPISTCQTTTPTATTPPATTPSATTPRATTTQEPTPAAACGSGLANGPAFLNSAKSAELIAGAYMPIIVSKWTWRNAPNSLTLAPLAKLGFITPTSSTTNSSSVTPSSSTTSPSIGTITTITQPVNPAQFYNFYAFGGRIGHFAHSADKNLAPALQSYIDWTIGRFSNLATLAPGNASSHNVPYFTRRWRINIEGLLEVPMTPLSVGFNANIGQNLMNEKTLQPAKDDLRFFIGAQFDVGKLLAKLPAF